MSVFAVPRSIARSREKSLYSPLNMERSEPWAAGERGAGRQQRGVSDATRAGARLCPGAALEFERAHHSTASAARAEMESITRATSGNGVKVQPLLQWLTEDAAPGLRAAFGAVLLLL